MARTTGWARTLLVGATLLIGAGCAADGSEEAEALGRGLIDAVDSCSTDLARVRDCVNAGDDDANGCLALPILDRPVTERPSRLYVIWQNCVEQACALERKDAVARGDEPEPATEACVREELEVDDLFATYCADSLAVCQSPDEVLR